MNDEDYTRLLHGAFKKLAELSSQRDAIEVEVGKLRQFIYATLNMLPDETRRGFDAALEASRELFSVANASLTDEIRKILQNAPATWLTAAQVRDRLVNSGFDFTLYASNPLASVSTTLRRLKPQEVETSDIEGVAAFRWRKGHMPSRAMRQAVSLGVSTEPTGPIELGPKKK